MIGNASSRRAFTLVELLIVIVVIGILIAIVVPSFIGVRDNARDSAAKNAVTVSYHNAKALWAQDEAFPNESALVGDLETAEPKFVFQTATPTSGNPEHVWIDTDAIAGDDEVTICSESGSGTWFCLRADETGTQFIADVGLGSEPILAAAGDTIAKSWGTSLENASCYLPTDAHEAGDGCSDGGEGWSPGSGVGDESESESESAPPVALIGPTVSGPPVEGGTLSASTGIWSNDPDTYAYQWQRDSGAGFTDVSGATSASYVLLESDEGASFRVVVTATNGEGSASATSAAVGPVLSGAPVSLLLPIVTGAAQQGGVLSTTDGAWSNTPATYAYQWQRSTDGGDTWTNISGATSATYTLTASDVSFQVRARVTATNGYGSGSEFSNAITSILPLAPTAASVPVISGTATEGSTLSTTNGTWNNSPTSYTYQWQRNSAGGFVNISGETSSTYTVAAADAGWTVRVRVTATNAGGSGTANSASVGPAVGLPVNSEVPTVSGSAAVGQTLTADSGAWSNSPTSYAYQWQRDSGSGFVNISGALSSTYILQAADENAAVRVRVIASNTAGSGAAALSAATSSVGPALLSSASLTFSGGPQYLDFGNDPTQSASYNTMPVTVEAWVKTTSTQGPGAQGAPIFSRFNSGSTSTNALWFGVRDGKLRCHVANGTNYRRSVSVASVNTGSWAHVACVWSSGGQPVLYINGSAAASTTDNGGSAPAGLATGTVAMRIGATAQGGGGDWGNYFDGTIDSVHYTRSVKYTGSFTPGELTGDANTVLLADLEEGSGSTTSWFRSYPTSGSGAVGLTGSPTWTGGRT